MPKVNCCRLDCIYISDKKTCTCKNVKLEGRLVRSPSGYRNFLECDSYEQLEDVEKTQKDIKEWFNENGYS